MWTIGGSKLHYATTVVPDAICNDCRRGMAAFPVRESMVAKCNHRQMALESVVAA
jgi:anaerobic ribonucleoside-triphosphate reductase